MNSPVEFFRHPDIIKELVDSLFHRLLVVDHEGRVRNADDFSAKSLDDKEKKRPGNLIGEVLGCLNAIEIPRKCVSTENCRGCDLRNLGIDAIRNNKVRKYRTSLQINNNGIVRDVDFITSAVPFTFNNQRFCILVVEDIPRSPVVTLSASQKGFSDLIGQHPKMKMLFRTIRQVAQTEISVLLQGETGTGKELVALAIHKESRRAQRYFVPINCGALPEGLLETELFGHVKGAFTGAIHDQKGRFEMADGGTLFLDEIGELSLPMQVKLLRVLQDGKFQRVGSTKTFRTDVRIISATNKDLTKELAAGRFRKDLFYRLCTMPITLPPLRERRSDIPTLANHFLAHYGKNFFCKEATLSSETITILKTYNWPGNVRELQNAMQFVLARCLGQMIAPSHLPKTIRFAVNKPFTVQHRRPTLRAEDVREALEKTDGNKVRAAELLGVSRSTLYRFFTKQEEDQS